MLALVVIFLSCLFWFVLVSPQFAMDVFSQIKDQIGGQLRTSSNISLFKGARYKEQIIMSEAASLTQQISRATEERSKISRIKPGWERLRTGFIAVDTETTGVSTARSKIIQVALVKYYYGTPTEKFITFINPKVRIPSSATKVNSITNDMIASAPSFADVAVDIKNFIGDYPLVGHNLEFDLGLLKEEFKRVGKSWHPKWGYCTMKETFSSNETGKIRKFPGQPFKKYYKLEEAMNANNIRPIGRLHDAYTDARGAGDICAQEMLKVDRIMRTKKEAAERKIEDLHKKLAAVNQSLKEMKHEARTNSDVNLTNQIDITLVKQARSQLLSQACRQAVSPAIAVKDELTAYKTCSFCNIPFKVPFRGSSAKILVRCPRCVREQYYVFTPLTVSFELRKLPQRRNSSFKLALGLSIPCFCECIQPSDHKKEQRLETKTYSSLQKIQILCSNCDRVYRLPLFDKGKRIRITCPYCKEIRMFSY